MRKGILLLLTVCVALLTSGTWISSADAATSRVAVIKELSGTVQVKKAGGSKLFKAFARMSLNEGDVISTGADGKAVLQFANGTSEDDKLSVSANATLTFSKLSDRGGTRTKVSMFNGTAWVDVKSIVTKNDEFTLETPTAVMGVRGTHLLVSVDPATGSTRLTVAAGVVSASTSGSSGPVNVLPNQDAVFTEEDEDVAVAPTDLALLMSQTDSAIVEAIIQASGEIVKENEEKKDQYVEQSGAQTDEAKTRLKSNVENLLGAIVDQAVKSGLISEERAIQLVTESKAQTGVEIDLTKKEIKLSEEEKQKQELQKKKEEDAKKAAEEQRKQADEVRKKNEDLLKKLEEARKQKEAANKQAEDEKKKKAEAEYQKQLDDAAKAKFEAEKKNREQEQQPSPSATATSTSTTPPSSSPSPVNVTVTFDSNGGSAVASQTVVQNQLATAPASPAKTGYTFAGWYSDAGLTLPFSFTTPIAANTTLYAKWTALTYTLKYAVADDLGMINGITEQTVNHGSSGTMVTAVPQTGYHFTGWSDGVTTASRTDENVMADLSVTALFAINSYMVSFVSNDGSSVAAQTVTYNDTAMAPADPTRTGYHFEGWYSDSGLTQIFAFTSPITANTTLYAKWTALTYTLNYAVDDEQRGVINGQTTQTVNYDGSGSTVTAVPNTGYSFTGWSDGVTTASRTDTNVTADLSVTATFAVNSYTVSFERNGGTVVAAQTVAYNGTATAPANPTKTDYIFDGWYSDSALTQAFAFATPITADLTLYAKWTPVPLKIFNAGFELPDVSEAFTGSDRRFLYGSDFNDDQKTAAGWTLNGRSGIQYNGSPFSNDTLAPEGTQTAILQMDSSFSQSVNFPAGTYTLSFQAASRDIQPQSFDVLIDSTVVGSFMTNAPHFDLYTTNPFTLTEGMHTITFAGKSADEDYSSLIDDVQIHTVHAVNFESNGGSAVAAQAVEDSALATEPAEPTRAGYGFEGWYSDSGLTQAFAFTTPITADTTLYAKWVEVFTVAYDANGAADGAYVELDRTGWTGMSSPSSDDVFAQMLDDDLNTRWSTGTSAEEGQYFILDMQTVNSFNRLVMDSTNSSDDYARGYEVYVSNDGNEWSGPIASGAGTGAIVTVDMPSQFARYVKVVQTGSAAGLFWSINELDLYTSGSTPYPAVYPAGTTVTVEGNTGNLVKSGYVFAGWNTAGDGSGTHYDAGDTFTLTEDVTLYAAWTMAPLTIVNAGFESPQLAADGWGYYDGPMNGWTFAGNYAGFSNNGSPFSGNAVSPEGVQVGFVQMTGSISQSVNFPAGTYAISFQAASRDSDSEPQTFDVLIDSDVVGSFSTNSPTFNLLTTDPFSVTEGTHTITFIGRSTADVSSLIDDVKIHTVHTVTFESNGGSAIAAQQVKHNVAVLPPAVAPRPGYAFEGWYSDSGLTQVFSFQTPITSDITLYAKWAALLSFTYDNNGAFAELDRTGWTGEASPDHGVSFSLMFDGDRNTRWTLGEGLAPGQYIILNLQDVRNFNRIVFDSEYSPSDYMRGYEISLSNDGVAWNFLMSGAGTSGIMNVNTDLQSARYVKVVQTGTDPSCYWSIHELRFYLDGITPPAANYTAGTTVIVEGNTGNMTRTGYDFTGWNTAADGSGTHFDPGDTFVMGTENMTLYAEWEPQTA